MDSAHAS